MKAAKATGVAGVLTPLLMWVIKAQWGSPVNLATSMLEKFQKRGQAASPKRDMRSTTRTISCP
jgi:hypothetical protein